MKKKTVAIIGTNGLPARYGGWDHLLRNLTQDLRERFDFIVYTSHFGAVPGLTEFNGAQIKIIRLKANGIQSIPYDIISMLHAAPRYDVLLILGTSGCIFQPFLKLFGRRVILNPDGAEWKRGKWGKFAKWFLKLSERLGVGFADCVIADNKVIKEFVDMEYGVKSVLIEYGGDNAVPKELTLATRELYGVLQNEYAFKVCRIEPENNIDIILEAFDGRDLKLILIGNWTNSPYGTELRQRYSDRPNMMLLDPIYDQGLLDELRSNCGIYVHGHSVGGTNPSLVEAMSLGLCCAVFKVDYNLETTEGKAIYFKSSSSLGLILDQFEAGRLNVRGIGARMLEIARRRYRWEIITGKYADAIDG